MIQRNRSEQLHLSKKDHPLQDAVASDIRPLRQCTFVAIPAIIESHDNSEYIVDAPAALGSGVHLHPARGYRRSAETCDALFDGQGLGGHVASGKEGVRPGGAP